MRLFFFALGRKFYTFYANRIFRRVFKLLIYIQTFDYYILTSSHVEQVERFCLNDKGEFQGELDLSSFREQNLKSGNQDFIRKH